MCWDGSGGGGVEPVQGKDTNHVHHCDLLVLRGASELMPDIQ